VRFNLSMLVPVVCTAGVMLVATSSAFAQWSVTGTLDSATMDADASASPGLSANYILAPSGVPAGGTADSLAVGGQIQRPFRTGSAGARANGTFKGYFQWTGAGMPAYNIIFSSEATLLAEVGSNAMQSAHASYEGPLGIVSFNVQQLQPPASATLPLFGGSNLGVINSSLALQAPNGIYFLYGATTKLETSGNVGNSGNSTGGFRHGNAHFSISALNPPN
jgi:hypothetical protein